VPLILALMCELLAASFVSAPSASAAEIPESERVAAAVLRGLREGVRYDHMDGTLGFSFSPDSSPGLLPTHGDIRISTTPMTATRMAPWTYPLALQGMSLMDDTVARQRTKIRRGWVTCVAGRPHYPSGAVGRWGTPNCTGRFLDDSALLRRGRVKRVRNAGFWRHRASVLIGGSLTLPGVPRNSSIITLATDDCGRNRDCRSSLLYYRTARGRASLPVSTLIGDRTIHSVEKDWVNRTGRRGPLVFRSSASVGPSNPIEGILVYPPWTGYSNG